MTDPHTQPPANPSPAPHDYPPPETPLPVRPRSRVGRIGLSLLIALAFGFIAGVAAWFLAPNHYRSTGSVDIRPVLKRVLFVTDQNTPMPNFDDYMNKQMAMMQQQRCIQFAMELQTWQTAVTDKSAKRTIVDFTNHLSVARQGELIIISFTDHDPDLAQAAVKSIINSYKRIVAEREDDDMKAKQILENRIAEYTRLVRAAQDRIEEITKEFGTEDLTMFYNSWATVLNNLDQQIVESQTRLMLSQGPAILNTQPATSRPVDITPAAVPPTTEDAAAEATRASQIATGRTQLRALREIRAHAYARTLGIGEKMRDVQKLKDDTALAKSTLEAAKRQSEVNSLESIIGGRTIVLSDGDYPLQPLLKPKIWLTAIVAGAVFILATLLAFLLLRPRTPTPVG